MDSSSSDSANRVLPGQTDWGIPDKPKLSLKSARARLGKYGRERWQILTVCAVMILAVGLGLALTMTSGLRSAFLSQIWFSGQGSDFKSDTRGETPAARIIGGMCGRAIRDKASGQLTEVVRPCAEIGTEADVAPIQPSARWAR